MKRRNTYAGRVLARDVTCVMCARTIEAGSLGYKKHHQIDLPDWTCEVCVP